LRRAAGKHWQVTPRIALRRVLMKSYIHTFLTFNCRVIRSRAPAANYHTHEKAHVCSICRSRLRKLEFRGTFAASLQANILHAVLNVPACAAHKLAIGTVLRAAYSDND